MLILRRGEEGGDFVNFLLYAVMAVYLYSAVFSDRYTNGVRPWAAVHSVFGLIFVPFALSELVDLIGDPGDSGNALNVVWIFGVTAALAFYAGVVKGVRFHILAGAIATIIAWSALWNKLLGDEGIAGHFGTYRGLLGILSILLLAGALYVWRRDDESRVTGTAVDDGGDQGLWKASELVTGAGIAAVIACSLGISSVLQFAGPLGLRRGHGRPDRAGLGRAAAGHLAGPHRHRLDDRHARSRLRRRDRPDSVPVHRRAGPERGLAAAGEGRHLADHPPGPGRRAHRAQLGEGGEPRRPAEEVRQIIEEVAELARRFLAALSEGDQAAVGELVHPEVEIRTERTTHRGRDAAVDWSAKGFDHLTRRYVPLEVEQREHGLLVMAELQYVWTETGDVGDTTRVGIALGVRDGLVSSWELLEDIG